MDAINSHDEVLPNLFLNPKVKLLNHGIAHAIVNNIDPGRSFTGEKKPTERVGKKLWRARDKRPILIQVNGISTLIGHRVSSRYIERQRASVVALFQRHD